MRLRCYLKEIRGERGLRDISAEFERLAGRRFNTGELSRIENGIAVARDDDLPFLVAAYGAAVEDWYPTTVLLALESDDSKLLTIRARLRTTLLPR